MTVEKKDEREATPSTPAGQDSGTAPYEPPSVVRLGNLHDLLGKSGRNPDNRSNPVRP